METPAVVWLHVLLCGAGCEESDLPVFVTLMPVTWHRVPILKWPGNDSNPGIDETTGRRAFQCGNDVFLSGGHNGKSTGVFFSLLLPHEIGNTCLCGLFHRSAVFLGTSPFLLLCGDQGCSSPFTSSFISGYHGIEAREMPYRIGRIPWEKNYSQIQRS